MKLWVLVILTMSLLVGCGDTKEEQKIVVKPVKSFTLGQKQTGVLRNFPGKVLPNQEAVLAFEVEGRLIELPVKEGQQYQKGDLLARLDPERYQDRVAEMQARYELAGAQLARAKALIAKGFVSQAEYDILNSEFKIAASNLAIAQRDLRNTVIYAPYNGIVAKKYVDNFEYVDAKEPVISFHDIANIDIEVFAPEDVAAFARSEAEAGSNLHAIFSAMPNKQYPVKFKEFSSEADPDTQTYRVVFTMPSPENFNTFPGMTVTVRGEIGKGNEDTYFVIPASAVFVDSHDQPSVWLIDPQTHQVKIQAVKVTRMSDKDIFVTDGLKGGDTIVAAGVHFLLEGDTVRELKPLPE